jgi:hypothetical protein
MRISKNFISGAKKAYRVTDRFAGKFGRWIVTDHTGFNRALNEMPRMGFTESCKYVLTQFIVLIICSLLAGLFVFLLIAIGIPFLITGTIR